MWKSATPKNIENDIKVGMPGIEVVLKLEKKAQCKSLKSVLCVCNTLVRLYDLVYLLLVTCLCLSSPRAESARAFTGRRNSYSAQCAVCKVYFSAQPNKLKPILNFQKYYPI